MPFQLTTPISEIRNHLQVDERTKTKLLVTFFCRIGEECVREARLHGSYLDQTGNLRSSIGYVVLVDGVVAKVGTPEQGTRGTDKALGQVEGNKYLQELMEKRGRKGTITLVVAAGMNYAAYVEAKGKVVLSSAEVRAKEIKTKILSGLGLI